MTDDDAAVWESGPGDIIDGGLGWTRVSSNVLSKTVGRGHHQQRRVVETIETVLK